LLSDADARQFLFSKRKGGRKATVCVNAQDSRALAQRCRDLLRIAVRSEVKEQLRQWVDDFEDEAAAMGRLNAPKRAADAETAEG
jgi:hypothetical protein